MIKNKSRSVLGFAILFSCSSAISAPVAVGPERVLVEKEFETWSSLNVYDLDPAMGPKKKDSLAELRWRELHQEWSTCRDLAAKLQPKDKEIEPWVARVRLGCAWKAAEGKPDHPGLASAVDAVKTSWLREGPWKESLLDLWIKSQLALLENPGQKNIAAALGRGDGVLQLGDLLSKDSRAAVLTALGELSLIQGEKDRAVFLWREAAELSPSFGLSQKIESVEKTAALNVVKNPDLESVPVEIEPPGAESETDREVSALLRNNQKAEAVRQMVLLMQRFPAGRLTKKFKDRVLEVYFSAADRGEEAHSVLDTMLSADASKLIDWAQQLHRRADYAAALALAEKALETQGTSPSSTSLLWIIGRSAHFLGQTDRAMRAYDQLVQFHGATDESGEALFRLAILQLRSENYAAAARLFERSIASKRERWELGSRYWRIRALERVDASKAATERDEVIRRFPFTYYGLKLRAEREGGVLEFPKNERSPLETGRSRFWLAGAQKTAWKRFKKLSAAGWILEAQMELSLLPAPQDPWSVLQWARLLAKSGQYPTAILLTNKALEVEENLRLPRYVDQAFPSSYGRWISAEAGKYGLDPILVKSLIRQESAFGLKALSSSNALGLMQLIPPTAQEVARSLKMKIVIPDDLFRPEINVPLGTSYIAQMINQFGGHVPLGLAAYNAGPVRLQAWIKGRPETLELPAQPSTDWKQEIWFDELPWNETSFYVKAILRNILLYRLIEKGRVQVQPAFWTELRPQTAMTK